MSFFLSDRNIALILESVDILVTLVDPVRDRNTKSFSDLRYISRGGARRKPVNRFTKMNLP